MTTQATHNGTCQCCGRVQAYSKSGVAKHGYTTEWGYFNGVCGGSDHEPLELATDLNVQTVAAMLNFANEQEAKAEGDITQVPVEIREKDARVWGKVNKRIEWMTREQFDAHQSRGYSTFDSAVKALRFSLRRSAEMVRREAADLEQLRDKVHGQPLQARAVEAPLRREYAKSYREAYARCEELKAEGKRGVRQRRQQGYGFAITYRD